MVAKVEGGKVTLYSRNGQIISRNYVEVAKAFEAVKGNAVIDGELVAIGKDGVSHFSVLQNALRHKAKLQYFVDLSFRTRLVRRTGGPARATQDGSSTLDVLCWGFEADQLDSDVNFQRAFLAEGG